MKILLVCAGGMSTSILMKKMEAYWKAVGLAEYQDICSGYDIVMVGPQVSYRLNEIKENTGLPCAAIESFDYAVANCPNIMKLAKKLYSEK